MTLLSAAFARGPHERRRCARVEPADICIRRRLAGSDPNLAPRRICRPIIGTCTFLHPPSLFSTRRLLNVLASDRSRAVKRLQSSRNSTITHGIILVVCALLTYQRLPDTYCNLAVLIGVKAFNDNDSVFFSPGPLVLRASCVMTRG